MPAAHQSSLVCVPAIDRAVQYCTSMIALTIMYCRASLCSAYGYLSYTHLSNGHYHWTIGESGLQLGLAFTGPPSVSWIDLWAFIWDSGDAPTPTLVEGLCHEHGGRPLFLCYWCFKESSLRARVFSNWWPPSLFRRNIPTSSWESPSSVQCEGFLPVPGGPFSLPGASKTDENVIPTKNHDVFGESGFLRVSAVSRQDPAPFSKKYSKNIEK